VKVSVMLASDERKR